MSDDVHPQPQPQSVEIALTKRDDGEVEVRIGNLYRFGMTPQEWQNATGLVRWFLKSAQK